MPLKHITLLVVSSVIALLALLLIQVNWMMRSADLREQLFNQQASLVLIRTVEDLCKDKETCIMINNCCSPGQGDCSLKLGKEEKGKIDSLITHYTRLYSIPSEYHYQVINKEDPGYIAPYLGVQPFCGSIAAAGVTGSTELKLFFPKKSYFILQEMGPLFFTSVCLIALLITLFIVSMKALKKEKEVLEQTRNFANNMMHELMTPMSNIGLASSMVQKAGTGDEKIKEYTGIIRDENERMKKQVARLLELKSFESDAGQLPKKTIEVAAIVRNAVQVMEIQAKEKSGVITFEMNASLATVRGVASELESAVINLLDNAIKYSEFPPEVTVKMYNRQDYICIDVTDKGIGIAPKDIQAVFDKFYRVPAGDVHNVKGFGIGLFYVKQVVERHGGIVEVKSEKGKGSTFTIILPVAGRK